MAGRQPYAYPPASYGNQPQTFPSQAYPTNHISNTRDIQHPPHAYPNISRSRSPDYQDPRVPRSPLPPASPRSPLTPASPFTPISPSQPMLSPASAKDNYHYNQPQYSHENAQNYYSPTGTNQSQSSYYSPTRQSPEYQPSSRAASPGYQQSSRAASPLTLTTPTGQSPGYQPSSRAASPLTLTTPTGQSPGYQPSSRAASPLTPTAPAGQFPGYQPSSRAASPLTPTAPAGQFPGYQQSSRAASPHMPPPVRQNSAPSQQPFVGNVYPPTPVRQNSSNSSFQATQRLDTGSPMPSNGIQTPNSLNATSLTKQQPLTRSSVISNEKSADASGTTLQPPRNQPRLSVAVSSLSERPSAIDKYKISPVSTQALWLNKQESDDDMHNPETLKKGGCVWFSKRGCLNVGAFIGIILIILGLFAAYPVYSAIKNGDFAVPVPNNDTLSANGTTGGNPQAKNHLITRELTEFLKADSPRVETDGATYNLVFEEEYVEAEGSVQTDKDST